jgi:hypothetical protein
LKVSSLLRYTENSIDISMDIQTQVRSGLQDNTTHVWIYGFYGHAIEAASRSVRLHELHSCRGMGMLPSRGRFKTPDTLAM